MKKIIKIVLVLFVTLTLGACGSSEEKDTNKHTKTEEKKEGKSIEETFGELDLLARKLEDKETPLEESFRLYRQGMELLKDLNGRLDTVEKKDASDE